MTYDVQPLGFDPGQLQGLSTRLLTSHHENNYTGAVKRLNAILERLTTVDYPLLALDMYEHSYHLDFGAKAAAYVDAFMANLRWERANQLFLHAQSAGAKP